MVWHKERQTARAHGGVRVLGTCDYRQKFGLPTAGQRGIHFERDFLSRWVNERTRNLSGLDHKLDLESGEETKSGNVHSTNLRSHDPQQRRCIRRIVVAAVDHHESLAVGVVRPPVPRRALATQL